MDIEPTESLVLFEDNENIFISDEEENDNREKAKSILGFSKDASSYAINNTEEDYTSKLEQPIQFSEVKSKSIEPEQKKPNFFVHDDDFSTSKSQPSTII